MPSIKMKTKSASGCLKEKNGLHVCQKSNMISKCSLSHSGCLKEKNGLHVCQKSNMISKCSLSHSKVAQHAEEIGKIIQNSQDAVYLHDKKHPHNSGGNEESDDGCLPTEKPPASAFDPTPASRMESTPVTCGTNSETIFSPIMDSIDIHSDSYIDCYGGSNNLYVPQLETEDSDDSSKGSCEYGTCSISDFFISDMIFSGIPVEGDAFDDGTDIKFFPDYKCEEPFSSFGAAEEDMLMPYLNDDLENRYVSDSRTCEETVANSGDSSLYMAIHQLRSCNQESELISYPDVDQTECFDPHIFIRNLPDMSDLASDLRPATIPKGSMNQKSVTLVLDLDETLVHSTLEPCDDADFSFPVFFNMKEHIVHVKKRPHLRTFLERVAQIFEIVVFTASQSIYAKQLLDILDPDGKLISRRAYRESCVFSDGSYTKDLTVLGVDLAKIVIIDNSPQVFRLQVNNGIPIKSWFDDPSDSALISLLPFLETLADADDVRPIIAKRFGNKE